ncbi:hypothetical protein RIR_e21701_A0A2I1HNA2_9GLOM [Rhizophagus irregularis DAOM 181602=DAOM 197198]|nr:hypothetical protein RIR_e21701_A0A2I1HNA2_9GLOM [Rhizophagus irregularis DAOM 181602=DAOM 197198]
MPLNYDKDQAIINALNVFLRRTLPPDDASKIMMSDPSYTSAVSCVPM